MLADVALRRSDYAEHRPLRPAGRYGDVRWTAVLAARRRDGAGLGPGHEHRRRDAEWQGYLLGPSARRPGRGWADANLGVLVALVVGFVGTLLLDRSRIRAQEA